VAAFIVSFISFAVVLRGTPPRFPPMFPIYRSFITSPRGCGQQINRLPWAIVRKTFSLTFSKLERALIT
jgi:hypothetical protein